MSDELFNSLKHYMNIDIYITLYDNLSNSWCMTYYVEEIATSPFSLAREIYFYSRYNLSQELSVLD